MLNKIFHFNFSHILMQTPSDDLSQKCLSSSSASVTGVFYLNRWIEYMVSVYTTVVKSSSMPTYAPMSVSELCFIPRTRFIVETNNFRSWGRLAHYCYVMSCLIWAWNFDGFTHLTVASKNQWQIWCTTDLVTRQVLCNVAGDLYRRITNCIVGTNWMVNFSNYVRKLDPFDFKSSCLYTLYFIAFVNIIHGFYHTLCQPSVIMRNSIRGPATKQAIPIPTLPKCMCDCCGFHGRRCAVK